MEACCVLEVDVNGEETFVVDKVTKLLLFQLQNLTFEIFPLAFFPFAHIAFL